ncbi:MAG TPA: YtxH domain-containing protein, partial [Trichococcus sp.]|nr:YtxH domain-containing protein [Trichococcus sp.]
MGKFSSFVKGLVIGGGIALLLSPKPGKDIRKDLA